MTDPEKTAVDTEPPTDPNGHETIETPAEETARHFAGLVRDVIREELSQHQREEFAHYERLEKKLDAALEEGKRFRLRLTEIEARVTKLETELEDLKRELAGGGP